MRTSQRIAAPHVVALTGSNESSAKRDISVESLPFGSGDVTAGTETNFRRWSWGNTRQSIFHSPSSARSTTQTSRRISVGEASTELIRELQKFLSDNDEQVWDNSWVRFPRKYLSQFASNLLDEDLKVNSGEGGEARSDRDKFVFATNWGEWVRVPISYLVKLALADVVGTQPELASPIKATAVGLLQHFANDLTSPETFRSTRSTPPVDHVSEWTSPAICPCRFCLLTCSSNGRTR